MERMARSPAKQCVEPQCFRWWHSRDTDWQICMQGNPRLDWVNGTILKIAPEIFLSANMFNLVSTVEV